MPIRTIFFDAAGTLIGLIRPAAQHYCEVARRHGFDIPIEPMHEAFRMTWAAMEPPPATRLPRDDDDREWWRAFVDAVFDRCAAPRDRAGFDRAACFDELYELFAQPGIWDVFPETRPVLEALAVRYQLGIISNFDRRLRMILEHLDLRRFFDPIVISSEVGADKPHPWIFSEALKQAGVAAGEALHVGDEPAADWEGAAAAGLHVFRLSRPGLSLEHLLRLLETEEKGSGFRGMAGE
jgi:putative hydrolase of the HAD superfamily